MTKPQVCSRSILDTTIPAIKFNNRGEANYCQIFDNMAAAYPKGEKGKNEWSSLLSKIKKKGKKYDCIVGISGGTDSCYLLHLAKSYGLNPLAVYMDNGWSTDASLKNIKSMTSKLNVDLETFVLNYEEIKDVLKSYMYASLPWIDFPTDFAIQAALFKVANREQIKYILIGYDFRSEGKQPTEWTYSDYKQLKHIHKKFGKVPLQSYPTFSFSKLFLWSYLKKIKMIRPYYYLDYDKQSAKKLLIEKYNWIDYGGHHHENAFTKFAVAYWLPKKFNIDKRKITLSAQVLSGKISREVALNEIQNPPYDEKLMEADKDYVIKKLGLTNEEFLNIWKSKNKSFLDYPSYYPLINKSLKILMPLFKLIFPWKPALFYEMEVRKQ